LDIHKVKNQPTISIVVVFISFAAQGSHNRSCDRSDAEPGSASPLSGAAGSDGAARLQDGLAHRADLTSLREHGGQVQGPMEGDRRRANGRAPQPKRQGDERAGEEMG